MKGVEPLVAEVMLIAVAFIMAGTLFTWYLGAVEEQRTSSAGSISCAFADIAVSDVFINEGRLRAVVVNRGDVAVRITSAVTETADGTGSHAQEQLVESGAFTSYGMPFAEPCGSFRSIAIYTSCAGVDARFAGTPRCG